MTRRGFLKSAAAAMGSGLLGGPLLGTFAGCASCPPGIPPANPKRRVFADWHVHPILNQWLAQTPAAVQSPLLAQTAISEFNATGMDWRAVHRARVDLICAAHFNPFDEWLSMPTDPNPDAPDNAHRMMAQLEAELAGPAAPYARLARNRKELQRLLDVPRDSDAFRVAVLHTLEGGHALGGSAAPLADFAARGVASVTITHFFDKGIASAPNAFPFFPDANSRWPHRGLTEFGKDVVAAMEQYGMIVDASHMTAQGLVDLLCVARRPFVATHASARTLGDHPYSFYDEHIVEIARRDGIVGVILYPHVLSNFSTEALASERGSLRDVVRTVRHIVKICGDDRHVAIGSDFGGFIRGPREMSCVGQIEKLRRALLVEFGSDETVEAILAGNTIRFLDTYWGR